MVVSSSERFFYMGLILAWGLPILAVQWFFGGHVSWRERKLLGMAIVPPTLYLWVVDAIAIHLGIWAINPRYLLGVYLGPLPIEEASFFLITTCMVAQGALLFVRVAERVDHLSLEGKRGPGSREGGLFYTVVRAAWRL